MKILMVNKFYYDHGGTEQVLFELSGILEKRGHQIIIFSMKDDRNKKSEYEKYFVSNLDYQKDTLSYKIEKLPKIVSRVIYSPEARRNIERLIDDVKPDIAHLHMIEHHISPSILYALKKANIPVIQSANNYKQICPDYLLYISRKNMVCEKCIGGHYYHCV